MKKIILFFLITLITGISSQAQVMTDVTGSLEQMSFAFSTWGDFDNDGDLDFYYTGELNANSNGGGLYINDNGSFSLSATSNLPLYNTGSADNGDFNGDGYPDIVVMGADIPNYIGHADIYINNTDGTFTALNAGLNGSYMGDVKFIDSDNDGDLDVLLTGFDNSYSYFTKLYINDSGSLSENTSLSLPELNFGKISVVDYDSDGDKDFVLSGWNNTTGESYTKIWKNEGNNVFTEQNYGMPQVWLGGMAWGDMDNDGDLDFVYSGTSDADSEIYLMINDNGTFTEDPGFDITPAHKGDIELADFNLDGYLDIFVVGNHYKYIDQNNVIDEKIAKIFVYDPATNSYIEDSHNSFDGVQYAESQAIDYDNDNKTDLFYTGWDSNNFPLTRLYHNDTVSGLDNEWQNQFEIYPNPLSDALHINPASSDNYEVQISDITGKIIYENYTKANLNINFSNYSKGVYFVKITENQKSFTKKIIKQ